MYYEFTFDLFLYCLYMLLSLNTQSFRITITSSYYATGATVLYLYQYHPFLCFLINEHV